MSNILEQLYKPSLVLLTDFYQLTMAYGYWQSGIHEREAVFYHSFRRAPFQGGYAVAAGLGTLIDYLLLLKFSQEDLAYLSRLESGNGRLLFSQDFLEYLSLLKFSCQIDAVEEGCVVFPQEPLVRVQGPLLQCQLLESILLNIINFQTLIATSAARLVQATRGDPVFEFGLRRAQGFDGSLMASRAAFVGGCRATSNMLAAKLYHIPLRGTHSHSWVLSFASELEAFRVYAQTFPEQCVLLVDTYDSVQGVKNAIQVANELTPQGFKLVGIRLDSGDLAYLSKEARKLLDEAGYCDTLIIGSNDLNPLVISSLKEQKAEINCWGVGTHLVTGYEQPALEGVYKLGAIKTEQGVWDYKVKLSEQTIKISTPGLLSVRRFYAANDQAIADIIYDQSQQWSSSCTLIDPLDATKRYTLPVNTSYRELLQPIFRNGQLVYKKPSLLESQRNTTSSLNQFNETIKRLLNPQLYPVGLEENLYHLKLQLILRAKQGIVNPTD